MRFDLASKTNLRALRAEIEAALATVATARGIAFKTGNIRFESDGTACRIQLDVTAPDDSGRIVDKEGKDFARYHALFGLSAQDFGAIIRRRDGDVKIVGLAMNRRKFPIVVEYCDGKRRVFITSEEVTAKLYPGRERTSPEIVGDLVPPKSGGLTLTEPPPPSCTS